MSHSWWESFLLLSREAEGARIYSGCFMGWSPKSPKSDLRLTPLCRAQMPRLSHCYPLGEGAWLSRGSEATQSSPLSPASDPSCLGLTAQPQESEAGPGSGHS